MMYTAHNAVWFNSNNGSTTTRTGTNNTEKYNTAKHENTKQWMLALAEF